MPEKQTPAPYRSTQLDAVAAVDPDLLALKLGSVHARALGVGMAAGLSMGLLVGVLMGVVCGVVAYGIAYAIRYNRAMKELASKA